MIKPISRRDLSQQQFPELLHWEFDGCEGRQSRHHAVCDQMKISNIAEKTTKHAEQQI